MATRIERVEAIPVSVARDREAARGTAGSPTELGARAGAYQWSKTVATVYSDRLETTLVKVTLDNGLVGWGEAQAPVLPRVSAVIIADLLAGVLAGESFDGSRERIEELWARLYQTMRVRGQTGGFMLDAISGIDIALWDLADKLAGMPVSRLIAGQSARPRVPAYLSGLAGEDRVAFAARHFDLGFRVFKIFYDADSAALLRLLDDLRARLGAEARLAVDALWRLQWPADQAFIGELAARNLEWLEAPFMPDLEHPPLPARLALGESYRTTRELQSLLGVTEILQPDLGRSGITETLRWAELGKPIVPHVSIAMGPQIAAAIQVCAALSNAPLCEYNPTVFAFANQHLVAPLRMEGAQYVTPEGPGLGIEVRF
ncbi:MAG: mandelate racemase/muconate lactonizing enzyme family protein [Bryobacteraceae bacterium]|nr:mandelate racemase/muconate lactonizing enzyme family protein [Bryobacteraceae bacterium]